MTLCVPDHAAGGRYDKRLAWYKTRSKKTPKTRRIFCPLFETWFSIIDPVAGSCRRALTVEFVSKRAEKSKGAGRVSKRSFFSPLLYPPRSTVSSFFTARQRLDPTHSTCRDRRLIAPRRRYYMIPIAMKHVTRIYFAIVCGDNGVGCFYVQAEKSTAFSQQLQWWWICGGNVCATTCQGCTNQIPSR